MHVLEENMSEPFYNLAVGKDHDPKPRNHKITI